MANIFPITYGVENRTDLLSGVPLAQDGLRLIDHSDVVLPPDTNRPLLNLARNDQEINFHLNEFTRILNDGVFSEFGEKFNVIRVSDVDNSAMTFEVRSGLGKIGNNAFHIRYIPNSRIGYESNENGETVPVTIPPEVTNLNIDVSSIGANQFRRDLIILDETGEIVVISPAAQNFQPSDYSQLDAPPNSIALYSILFRKISGISQTPVVNAVYDEVEIEGLNLIQNFTRLFGNGIFLNEPVEETDPEQKEFTPSVAGGNVYQISAGKAIINGGLVEYGSTGASIILNRAETIIGTGATPGVSQGDNTNGWELVDFTTNSEGAAGTGNGNTQYLVFDNSGKTGLIDAGSIVIYTASPTGEGGYSVQRPFDINAVNAPSTEEYSIDVTNGLIRREKSTAPLRIFIKYSFTRNRRYLPYFNEFGVLNYLQSADEYPLLPAEFNASDLPVNTIGLKSILFAATDTTLQPVNLGNDFRTYQNFQLVNGQVPTEAIQDQAITGPKIASGAIDSSSLIGPGVITESNLANDLLSSLSSSKVYARSSLAFRFANSDNIWSFSDHKDAVTPFLTKQLTDITGVPLTFKDAELQTPSDRPVVSKPVFKDSVATEVELDPELARQTITITSDNISNIKENGSEIQLSAIAFSFQDFGFSQVGNVQVILYNPSTDSALATKTVAISTIKNFVQGKVNAFYKFTFDSPVNVLLGGQYQIRIAKTVPTDTVFVHTASEGASRFSDLSYRAYFLPENGRYGVIGGNVQGYRIFDDLGDITIPNVERAVQGRPDSYIPYAANITDRNSFTVFESVDSDVTNYIAVDVTRGIFKFSEGSEPTTTRIVTDHNIITGLANLSSERIHRENGLTIEHTLRVLENELGSVRANVTNFLERLYFLGRNETGAKFRFSSEDRPLTDLSGEELALQDGNLSNPINVVDNAYFVPEGRESEREIQDAFNSLDVIEFTARFNNVAIFAVNFTEAGTDYDAVQIALFPGEYTNDSLVNPPITSVTLARASIKTEFNFFPLEAQLEVGETYHVLIRVINFLGGLAVRPAMLVDVENDMIEYQQYFLPDPGAYGTVDGYAISDIFGDLSLGSEARGAVVDARQENFLDADGWQIQPFFDDNDINPSLANTTFPAFSASRPDRTGMVRFDVYMKSVPNPGQDGFNGVFRLLLHDSNNNPIRPNNARPGQDFLEVRVPRNTGWYEIPFQASLVFGETYHMHMWANGFDIQLYVGTHAVTDQKAFRFVAGERFIPFAANLCEPDSNFDDFEIVARKLVAVDVRCGRIKFHPDDIEPGNTYTANFNLFTNTADLQSDTIITPEGDTIQNKFIKFVNVRREAEPTRIGIGLYSFNPITNKLADELGRRLSLIDGELTNPYERISIEDTDITGTPSVLTTTDTDNQYNFFIDNFERSKIESIILNYSDVEKDYFDTILRISVTGSETPIHTAVIKSTDLQPGFNDVVLEDVSGNPINFIAEPGTQYTFSYIADVSGPGTAPSLSKNSNNTITTTIKFRPLTGGFYGTDDGVTIEDEFGDIFRFNLERDSLVEPVIIQNTGSGLVNLKNDSGTDRGLLVWQETNSIKAVRYNVANGELIDNSRIDIAGGIGDPAVQPNVSVYDEIAYTVWKQSGEIYGRRLFLNESDPLTVDSVAYQLSDTASGNIVNNPSVAAERNRMVVVWEDSRDVISGTPNAVNNNVNIVARTFEEITQNVQFNPETLAKGDVYRVNESLNLTDAEFKYPEVSIYKDNAVFVFQSDIENIGLSNNVYLSVRDLAKDQAIRTNIRVDKAPVIIGSQQVDSKLPKIDNFRNKFAITWLDDRDSPNVQYQPYGKVYDSNLLTFDQSDLHLSNDVSGVVSMDISTSEKIFTIAISNESDSYVKRFDFASMTQHDEVPFNVNMNNALSANFGETVVSIFEKELSIFSVNQGGNSVIRGRVIGENFEPIATDLSNDLQRILPGYIGIDVRLGLYKFSEGEEI